MARNKSSHKRNIWNDAAQRFELRYINPTKAGRQTRTKVLLDNYTASGTI
jgi:hypothetical protein